MKKIKIFFLFFIVVFLIVNITFVFACSCASFGTPTEELKEATAVFSGKVIDKEILSSPIKYKGFINGKEYEYATIKPVKVYFNVSKVWKGTSYKTFFVITERYGDTCGYSFEVGEDYIVYSYGNEDLLHTNICTRTNSLSRPKYYRSNPQEDLEELGEGEVPYIESSNLSSRYNYLPILLVVVTVISITGISFYFKKYKK